MSMDVVGCLGCDFLAGRRDLPGGLVHQTPSWAVNHVVGPMNLGTLVVSPREHVVAIADIERFCARARELFQRLPAPERRIVTDHGD